jgi:ribosomal protein S18 acetylase RimI-like enzyme
MVYLQTISAEEWTLWRELRLSALEEAPYAFGSTLADWQGDGDYESRWRDRLDSIPFNVIADLDDRPAGMVSATGPDAEGDVQFSSLWVAPFARGRGVGDSLLGAVGMGESPWCRHTLAERCPVQPRGIWSVRPPRIRRKPDGRGR